MLPNRNAIAASAGPRWRDVTVVESTGSTNLDLVEGVRAGQAPGRVLIADLQTAGRGRHQRSWSAPAGTQLAISVSVEIPAAAAHRLGWLTLAAGSAAAAAVRSTTGVAAVLKWPNDLMIEAAPDRRSGKVAGLLAELVAPAPGAGGGMVAVIGLGLNVTLSADELPVPTATSLALAGGSGAAPDRTELAIAYLAQLDRALDTWATDPVATRAAYLAVCDTVGREVTVHLPDGVALAGTAVDVDAEGRIVVQAADGRRALSAGDVTHLRPV